MQPAAAPAILSISSHVARGGVGNRAITFACESLGLPVWAVNTVSLPFHPGHGKAVRIEPDPEQFSEFLDDLLGSPWLGEIGAVLTGYMGSARQAMTVGRFVARLRRLRPEIIHLCDPVIGDAGGLYVGADVAAAIRDDLLADADWATPNVHELAWLAGAQAGDDLTAIATAARRLGPERIVVTSAPALMRGHIANLLVEPDTALLVEHTRIDHPPNGPGDLTAGLLAGHLVQGLAPARALEKATASVFEIVARSTARGSDELMLAANRASVLRPMAPVNIRHVVVPAGTRRAVSQRPLAGVDGCRAGWIAVIGDTDGAREVRLFETFAGLLETLPGDTLVAVDMPIGLPERTGRGGRGPEQAIRPMLGQRQSSVFSIPARSAVYSDDYRDACSIALATSDPPRKVSRQGFALFAKIREIDALMTRELEGRVFEVHPELAFCRLNGGTAMSKPKKIGSRVNPDGIAERRELLATHGFAAGILASQPPRGAAPDDLIDACACFMVATRIAAGKARPFPDPPLATETGARMAIWA